MVINVHSSNDNTKMPELISLLYIKLFLFGLNIMWIQMYS